MAVPTIVLLASATVTLVGLGPILGFLEQQQLVPAMEVHPQVMRPAAAPSPEIPTLTVAATSGQASRKNSTAVDVYQIPAGAVLFATLKTAVGSDASELDDQVRATLRTAVTQDGVELVPSGSVLLGKVVEVAPASRRLRQGRVAFAFKIIEHAGTGSRASIETRIITRYATMPDPAVAGRSAATHPVDVQLRAGEPLTVTLAEPLIVRIPK